MQETIKRAIVAELENMTELLGEYNGYAEELLCCQTDEEINEHIAARDVVVEKLKLRRSLLDAAVASCEAEEKQIIGRMLEGKPYSGSLDGGLGEIREAVAEVRSAQLDAISRDGQVRARLSARFNEIKLKLEELNDDRKKINFISNSSGGSGVGISLDSHS